MEQVLQALSKLRIGVAIEEYDIHLAIAQVLNEADIPYCREYKLGPGNRIDFLTQSGIMGDKTETEEDKAIAQAVATEHMNKIIGKLKDLGNSDKPRYKRVV